jgi:hypothetical protein
MENYKEAGGGLNDIFTSLRKLFVSCLSFDLVCALNTPRRVYPGSRVREGLAAPIILTAAVIPLTKLAAVHTIHSSTAFPYCLQAN